jgi:hypothetical protein
MQRISGGMMAPWPSYRGVPYARPRGPNASRWTDGLHLRKFCESSFTHMFASGPAIADKGSNGMETSDGI